MTTCPSESHHLLFTPLLLAERDRDLETYLEAYFAKYPDKENCFVRNVVKPHSSFLTHRWFRLSSSKIQILKGWAASLHSEYHRKTPTPFVACRSNIVFHKALNLREEIDIAENLYPIHYPNMDPTGEILLCRHVYYWEGHDPKKSRLPRTLTKEFGRKITIRFRGLQSVVNF